MCGQTWTLEGEHSVVAALSNWSIDSISSREHGWGSARKSAPESDAFATVNCADDAIS